MYSHFFYKVALKGILAFSLIVATLVALPATAQLKNLIRKPSWFLVIACPQVMALSKIKVGLHYSKPV